MLLYAGLLVVVLKNCIVSTCFAGLLLVTYLLLLFRYLNTWCNMHAFYDVICWFSILLRC
jgi:hypothetical protein